MKLRNKRTGEIGTLKPYNNDERVCVWIDDVSEPDYIYNSLDELNAEWEDYEEPKEQYYIKENGVIDTCGAIEDDIPDEMLSKMKQIGNYFSSKEEAEKAVEKLKAWKRLKDKGFKFKGWRTADLGADKYYFVITAESDDADKSDLDLLFSGGEE